jgi:large repetitive protein
MIKLIPLLLLLFFPYNVEANPIRVNCGGPAYTDFKGNVWSADTGFTGGSIGGSSNTAPVSETENDVLYQTERIDRETSRLTYSFAVPNGEYIVRLLFNEFYYLSDAVGKRVFDVLINDQKVLFEFDIFAEVGGNVAVVKIFRIFVTEEKIAITFGRITENPKISAIDISWGYEPPPDLIPDKLNIPSTLNIKVSQ